MNECEAAWERVFVSCNELGLALVAARASRNISIVAGHQILAATGKATALAGDGQSELAGVHRLLEKLAAAVGIETMDDDGYGDSWKPPQ